MSPAQTLKGRSFGFIIDPLESLNVKKDTSLAMMRAAQAMGADVFIAQMHDLYIAGGDVYGRFQPMDAELKPAAAPQSVKLADLSGVFMRKDPPMDTAYYACVQILHVARRQGARIYNDPRSLSTESEKLFALQFPDLIPETLVTARRETLHDFLKARKQIIVKPMNAMGGAGVFLVKESDLNFDVIWETITNHGAHAIVAQSFLPEIMEGDKRVIIFNGQVFDHMLVRTPKDGSVRGNMAAGGSTHVARLGERDREIAETVAPLLMGKGIVFAGIDIIGDNLIEINHTSPTGTVQISYEVGHNIMEDFFETLGG